MRADAIHSLVDVFASIALILELAISSRKSKSFPYGLYKVENMVSIIISLLLFLTAYEIALEAIKGDHAAIGYEDWVLIAVAALISVPLIFGSYEVSMGKKANSPSLVADGSQFKVSTVKEVLARNSGRYLFVEVSVTLRITDLKRAHQAGQHIENAGTALGLLLNSLTRTSPGKGQPGLQIGSQVFIELQAGRNPNKRKPGRKGSGICPRRSGRRDNSN